MQRLKLTVAGKVVVFLAILAVVIGVAYTTGGFNVFKKEAKTGKILFSSNATNNTSNGNGSSNINKGTMDLSLDEWIGWKPIIDANGGLDTKPGSIFDKLGIKVKISIINDATQSSTALINKNIDAAGYTINRYAFLYPKFVDNKTPIKMVYVTNYSNGGDGIISKTDVNGIESLVNKTIAVPRYSEAQTLLEWLFSKSSLTDEQIKNIRLNNIKYFNSPDDAAKAFFAGQVDAAATWQPYLSQAQQGTGSKVLFSTKSATNIILDGIAFRQDYLDANNDTVAKFVEGSLKAAELYATSFTPIKDSMPLFATETNENIKGMTQDAQLTDYSSNVKLFSGVAQSLFRDMSMVWSSLGEKSMPEAVNEAFANGIINSLSSKFTVAPVETPKFTEQQREKVKNTEALLKQTFTINFRPDSDEFVDREVAMGILSNVAETAKILDNTIIQIEGNTSSNINNDFNVQLSLKRANAIAQYLKYQDLNPTRFIVIGNGASKPIVPNTNEPNREKNRRTDVFFKTLQ